ncbi:DUF637 domain-containing protein [Alcanivorax marinus]|uniref:DUF637 domain-containing protein n=1 Tax=Alloalcanivorax marinus TaxID=1177169 RepID=A0A9Q3YND6_9GAMM|nr:DUF637 domain-containing protein [Alloalcanivorax marinus]MCC4307755.1 DUF637 domain-containing protein [Alloalcanivorax marinus]MCU5786581.1 filamentous hemagglutinin [Alloalcanivorax marinus]
MAYALSLLLIWQPLLAAADGVTPTAGGVDRAANGVPVVNIRNPNGAGVSHNFYQDLNVDRQGLILNNGRGLSQTELAGYIEANPNLKNGSARLILNEVIGANPSALNGYLEVGGARADVVIANPNGITCNGCGFINTDHATLTTGRALMNADGALQAFDVQGGRIHIGADGANTGNVDRFDLIARSVSLAGAINADQLNVIAGRQRVDPRTLATEGLSAEGLDGETPAFAIDAAALGGMYANRIRLIGNESGVGVRLDAPVAAQNGDLTLSANGRLSFSHLSASESVQLAAADVTANGHLVAGDRIDVQADAWRAVTGTTSADVVEMTLNTARLEADAEWLGVDRLTVNTNSLDNAGDLAGGEVILRAGERLDNQGTVVAGANARLEAGDLNNQGTLAANDDLNLTATTVRQDGTATAGGRMRIDAERLENTAGAETVADGALRVSAAEVDNRGLMHGGDRLDIEAATVIHREGRLQSSGEVHLKADALENRALVSGAGKVTLETDTLANRGTIVAEQALTVAVEEDFSNRGDLQGLEDVSVTAGTLDNQGDLLAVGALHVSTGGRLENQGSVQAEGALSVDAGDDLINDGDMLTNSELNVRSGGLLRQRGRLVAGAGARLDGAVLINEGLISVVDQLLLEHAGITNAGTLEAGERLSVSGQVEHLNNTGLLRTDGAMRIAAAAVDNEDGGTMTAAGHLVIEDVERLNNRGLIMARGDLALRVRELLNERTDNAGAGQGTLGAAGDVLFEGEQLRNRGGALIGSGGAMTLRVIDTLDNDHADIVANGDLLIAADEALAKTGRVNNHSGTITTHGGNLSIFTRYLDNSREVILGKSEPLSGLAALEMMLVGLSKDDVALSEEDRIFIHDPDLSTALVRFASNGGARHAWVDYWVEQYTDYINDQIGGLLSEADVLFIQETLRGTREDTMIGTQPQTFYYGPSEADDATDNPLAESFYVVARVTQLLKERAPLKYQRFLAHTRAKLESEEGGGLYLRNFTCGTRRADWSDGVSCDNGSIFYFRFGDELYDDVIDPGSEAAQSVLSSGGDLTVVADTLNNAYSTLAAAGNIHLEGDRLVNKALELKRHGSLYTGRREWHNAKDAPAPGAGMVTTDVRDISVGLGEQVASVISAGGDLTLDFQDEAGNYTEERYDQEVVFDEGDYGDGGSGEPGDGGAGGDGPAPVAWDLSDDSRVIDTINAGLRDILDHRSSLYTVVEAEDHPYLIETNPLFATLDGFLGSGYLLDRLELDPDRTSRRLGDSYYETQLIRDAVLAATGRRFLDGDVDSDQQQFQRLMDNALLEAERLELAVGVALTPEQIDGLRQDMVWMEERQVGGYAVLVPVLYLAPGSSQLTREGAVIAGDTVNVRVGGLGNSGIIAAANGLNIQAGNKGVVNLEGTLQAGTGLAIDSRGDVKNQSGTVRAGLVSIRSQGDIINESFTEQVVTEWDHGTHRRTRHGDAGLIQGADIVSLDAGGDIAVIGSRVRSDTVGLNAGGDVRIESQTLERGFDGQANGGRYQTRTIKQVASQVDATGDLLITAGRNIGITASDVSAGGNAALAAGGDVIVQSAADRDYENYHRQTRQEEKQYTHDTVRQRKAAVGAGGSLTVDAGRDLLVAGSDLASGQDMHLAAGGGIAFLATRDSEYHLAKSEKDGDYGAHSMRRDEVTRIDHVTSTATAGGDLTLTSDGDQLYQAARLESGGDTTLKSGGHITFESVKDLVQESHEKSQGDLAWQKMEGQGFTDETLRQTEIAAAGNLAIDAAEGLHIDVKQVDQQTVEQMIDGMAAENPDLAWMKDAYQRGDVDWRQVRELHDSWEYSSQGMGPAAALAVTIVVTAMTAGAGAAAGGAVAGGATGATATAVSSATSAIVTSAASTAAVSTINNGGDLGATLDTLGSGDTLRGLAVGGLTAGLTSGIYDPWLGTETGASGLTAANTGGLLNNSGVVTGATLSSVSGLGRFALNQTLQNTTSYALGKAFGQEGDFSDALRNSMANTVAAAGFNWVGDVSLRQGLTEGGLAKTGLHTVMGGLAAEAAGGDFRTGALAGATNELLIGAMPQQYGNLTMQQKVVNSQLFGVLSAAAQGGDEASLQTGAWVTGEATKYNHGFHLPSGLTEYGQSATSLAQYMQEQGSSPDQINEALQAMNRGDGFDGPKPANSFLEAWVYTMLTGGGYMKAGSTAGSLLLGGALGGGTNVAYQLGNSSLGELDVTDASVAAMVGSLTQGRGFLFTEGVSVWGAYVGSQLKGSDARSAMIGAGIGAAAGRAGEKASAKKLNLYFPGASADFVGGAIGSVTNEAVSSSTQDRIGGNEN